VLEGTEVLWVRVEEGGGSGGSDGFGFFDFSRGRGRRGGREKRRR